MCCISVPHYLAAYIALCYCTYLSMLFPLCVSCSEVVKLASLTEHATSYVAYIVTIKQNKTQEIASQIKRS